MNLTKVSPERFRVKVAADNSMIRVLKIISVIILIIGLAIGVYFLWRYLNIGRTPQTGNSIVEQSGPPTETSIKILPVKDVSDFWFNEKTKEIYFITDNGQISKIGVDGEVQIVSSQIFSNLNRVKPSSDGSAALIAIGYPQSPAFSVFNTKTKAFMPLPAGTTAAAWDPASSNRLAVLQGSGPTARLKLLTLNNLKTVELLKINNQDLDLDWPSADLIYLKERPSDKNPNSVWLYNVKTKAISLFAQGSELVIKWLSNKDMGFRWSANALNIINSKNQELASFSFKTSPDKCAFVGTSIIDCAINVKRSANVSSVEYLKGSTRPQDAIYFISGFDPARQTNLVGLNLYGSDVIGSNLDVKHLELRNNDLLFINNYDHKLYSLPL